MQSTTLQERTRIALHKAMPASSPLGTEHEYSISNSNFEPLAISDKIIQRIHGQVVNEVTYGGIKISKELQKHVLELIPARPGSLSYLEENLFQGCKSYTRRQTMNTNSWAWECIPC